VQQGLGPIWVGEWGIEPGGKTLAGEGCAGLDGKNDQHPGEQRCDIPAPCPGRATTLASATVRLGLRGRVDEELTLGLRGELAQELVDGLRCMDCDWLQEPKERVEDEGVVFDQEVAADKRDGRRWVGWLRGCQQEAMGCLHPDDRVGVGE
jgi:hypothetical protein